MKPRILILATLIASAFAAPSYAGDVKGPLTETGEIGGAEFLIEIPKNWNRGLLMYAHGYALSGSTPQFSTSMVDVGHKLGYAVAQSKYSRQGWAAEEGVHDTEALRQYFVAKYGKTGPTIIAGRSQGAAITYYTIERYPEHYDGALPMCGTAEPTLGFMKERIFDMRLLFDYFFPGLPGSVVEFPEGKKTYASVVTKARELVENNPEAAAKYAKMVNLPDLESIPDVIAFWSEILRELQERTGGNGFDNRDTIYEGSDDDIRLNRKIRRYAADPQSVEYLRQWVTIKGDTSDPILALHTIVDPLIPPTQANYYDLLASLHGTTDLFVAQYNNRTGHCNFTAAEMESALDALTKWIKRGRRPVAGDITKD